MLVVGAAALWDGLAMPKAAGLTATKQAASCKPGQHGKLSRARASPNARCWRPTALSSTVPPDWPRLVVLNNPTQTSPLSRNAAAFPRLGRRASSSKTTRLIVGRSEVRPYRRDHMGHYRPSLRISAATSPPFAPSSRRSPSHPTQLSLFFSRCFYRASPKRWSLC